MKKSLNAQREYTAESSEAKTRQASSNSLQNFLKKNIAYPLDVVSVVITVIISTRFRR